MGTLHPVPVWSVRRGVTVWSCGSAVPIPPVRRSNRACGTTQASTEVMLRQVEPICPVQRVFFGPSTTRLSPDAMLAPEQRPFPTDAIGAMAQWETRCPQPHPQADVCVRPGAPQRRVGLACSDVPRAFPGNFDHDLAGCHNTVLLRQRHCPAAPTDLRRSPATYGSEPDRFSGSPHGVTTTTSHRDRDQESRIIEMKRTYQPNVRIAAEGRSCPPDLAGPGSILVCAPAIAWRTPAGTIRLDSMGSQSPGSHRARIRHRPQGRARSGPKPRSTPNPGRIS